MIIGAHSIVYSKDPDADRVFFRDVLGFPKIDVGGGWLIFGLPPSEAAFHPGKNNEHEFYLMCDDVHAFIASMEAKGVTCSAIHEAPWGSLTSVRLPGGGELGVYQPKHARPKFPPAIGAKRRAAAKKPAKKPARKSRKK